jgi:Fic family protein
MKQKVHALNLDLDWKLVKSISAVDRFDASWTTIEKKEGQSLRQLKAIATVRSVGASTRIEGSNMSDNEVELLLANIDITKLEDRDAQEVVGYFEAMDIIAESFAEIDISESSIKNLHNILLRYSSKDEWHRGDYKQHSNSVEATYPDGSKQIIFHTTEPGFSTINAMQKLIDWYMADTDTHPLVKCALFSYEFVTIHPFQDGNGRLSRLLINLLLLKEGYKWLQYVSAEHEIESRKTEYYRVLRTCQAQRPNENVSEWVVFFFDVILKIQGQLLQKLAQNGIESRLSARDKAILTFIEHHPGSKSGEISEKLGIPILSIKRALSELYNKNLVERHGLGPGVNYTLK